MHEMEETQAILLHAIEIITDIMKVTLPLAGRTEGVVGIEVARRREVPAVAAARVRPVGIAITVATAAGRVVIGIGNATDTTLVRARVHALQCVLVMVAMTTTGAGVRALRPAAGHGMILGRPTVVVDTADVEISTEAAAEIATATDVMGVAVEVAARSSTTKQPNPYLSAHLIP